MKHLLSAIALAGLIGAVPAWAQTSSGDQSKQPTPQASSSDQSASGTSMGKARRGTRSPEDNMAEELNRQELQRVEAGTGTTAGSGATSNGMSGSSVNSGAATSGTTTPGTDGSSLPASGAPRGASRTGNMSDRAGSGESGHPSPGTMEEHPGASGKH